MITQPNLIALSFFGIYFEKLNTSNNNKGYENVLKKWYFCYQFVDMLNIQ